MIARGLLLAAMAAIACTRAAFGAAPAAECPGAREIGTTANGKAGEGNEIVAVSALTSRSPGGDVTFASFAYVYTTHSGARYLQDTVSQAIVPIGDPNLAAVRSAYRSFRSSFPAVPVSAGATALMADGWMLLSPVTCRKP
jgi:hypothetical protein